MSRLANVRKRQGLSQVELAKASGVSPATVNLIENGKRKPHPSTLKKLAIALGVDVEYLTREEGKMQVEVGAVDQEGKYRGEILRFTGELVDTYERGNFRVELYECPDGYRVYTENEYEERRELYPSKPDHVTGRLEYPLYSAEDLVEEWPEFGAAVGVKPIRDLD